MKSPVLPYLMKMENISRFFSLLNMVDVKIFKLDLQKVGCDWVVGSNATEDECGICEGDNSKCNIFKGTYTKQVSSPGYREVVVIPAGATNIKIIEANYSENFISIGSALHKIYYLNGKK